MLRRPFQRGPQAAVVVLAVAAALAPSARGIATAPSGLSARAAASAGVAVSPLPGTPDASPSTQISFLGGPGTKVARVTVTGSRSGGHSGTLEAYSTGTGESFIPRRPFDAGERVSVSAEVTGGGPAAVVRTAFTVAREATVTGAEFPAQPGNPADVLHFRSAPTLTPSSVRVTTPPAPDATPGDLFLAPYQGTGTPGPMITDQAGNLIWFHPLPPGDSSTNFRPQTYNGKTVLTWWQGHILKLGFGQGEDWIYNTSYQPITHVSAGNGYHADLHEFLLTPQDTAWIDAFDPIDFDLRGVGGSTRGVVTDSVVEEIDIKTGLVMWEWHALGHIPLRDSYSVMQHGSHPWDYAHVNSIDPSVPGQLLLSSRNTWTVFDVDLQTGAVIWRIGGRQSSFRAGPGTVFRFQHDAAWQPGGLISLFDNGYVVDGDTQSRGLLLDPDSRTRRVTLVKQFANPNEKLQTASQGDLLNLGDGNWLMGYGGLPNFTEYDSSGKVLLDGTLGPGVEDYRTYLAPWSGHPTTLPSIAAQPDSGGVTVEASWNGATAVSSWRVLAGPSPGALTPAATATASGFETTIQLATPAAYVAVAALGGSGATLATSAAIAPAG